MQFSKGARPGGCEGRKFSQLWKPLCNCLHDHSSPLSVLEYLIQFMAARDALHLLQFWFSVASFQNAAPSHSGATINTGYTDTQHCTPATTGVQVDKSTSHTQTTQPYHTTADLNIAIQAQCTAVPTPLSTIPGNSVSTNCDSETDISVGGAITGVVCDGSGKGMNGVAGRGEGGGRDGGHTMTHRPTRQHSLSKSLLYIAERARSYTANMTIYN